jgi:hypothetical protein
MPDGTRHSHRATSGDDQDATVREIAGLICSLQCGDAWRSGMEIGQLADLDHLRVRSEAKGGPEHDTSKGGKIEQASAS